MERGQPGGLGVPFPAARGLVSAGSCAALRNSVRCSRFWPFYRHAFRELSCPPFLWRRFSGIFRTSESRLSMLCVTQYHTHFYFLSQSSENPGVPGLKGPSVPSACLIKTARTGFPIWTRKGSRRPLPPSRDFCLNKHGILKSVRESVALQRTDLPLRDVGPYVRMQRVGRLAGAGNR